MAIEFEICGVTRARVDVVDKHADMDTSLCRLDYLCGQHPTRLVVVPKIVHQVEAMLGTPSREQTRCECIIVVCNELQTA
jgi:hypothetical protein